MPRRQLYDQIESLDYEPVQSRVSLDRHTLSRSQRKGKKIYGYTGQTVAKVLLCLISGALTGAAGVVVIMGSRFLRHQKNSHVQDIMDQHGIVYAALAHFLFAASLVIAASLLVQLWAPAAAGAGVSLVMAYLNGSHVPNLLRGSTLVTKLIGTVCGCASSLAVGPEGPMVHLGACITSAVSNAVYWRAPGLCALRRQHKERHDASGGRPLPPGPCAVWEELGTDADEREFISAGAAAGISAAFGAPIGGVLFSLEEASTYWSKRVAWRCFLAAVMAAFVIAQFNDLLQSLEKPGEKIHESMLGFGGIHPVSGVAWLRQAPFMAVLSVAAGLLGAVFNSLRVVLWPVRASRSRHLLRVGEVVAVAAVVTGAVFGLATAFGRCMPRAEEWPPSYGMRWRCPEGQHLDLATAFLSGPEETIRSFMSVGRDAGGAVQPSPFTQSSLLLFCLVYLVFMALGSGMAVPAGLFLPAIMVGGSFGLWVGVWLEELLPASWEVQPGVFALIGATGVLGGVFRSAISLVVIIVEGTRGIDFIFGVIIAVVCSNWVAHHIHKEGVYESELERDGNLCFLRPEPPHALMAKTAQEVMAPRVVGVRCVEEVSRMLQVLHTCQHNGFPVLSCDSDGDTLKEGYGRLEGLVLRSQLIVLLRHRVFCDENGAPLSPSQSAEGLEQQTAIDRSMRLFFRRNYIHHRFHATSEGLDNLLNSVPPPLGADPRLPPTHGHNGLLPAKLSDSCPPSSPTPSMVDGAEGTSSSRPSRGSCSPPPELLPVGAAMCGVYVDVRPYMNAAPLTVRKETSATRVHQMFLALGMRHLAVVNSHNSIVGMVTRKDLDQAAGRGCWRHTVYREPAAPIGARITSRLRAISRVWTRSQPPSAAGGSPRATPGLDTPLLQDSPPEGGPTDVDRVDALSRSWPASRV